VPLDSITLRIYIDRNDAFREIEKKYLPTRTTVLLDPTPDSVNRFSDQLRLLGVADIQSLTTAVEKHKDHLGLGIGRCAQVDYGGADCSLTSERGSILWMLIQLLCADKEHLNETLDCLKAIRLWIPDSLERYAESLRAIVRNKLPQDSYRVAKYQAVYATIRGVAGYCSIIPLRLVSHKWVWEDVVLADDGLYVGSCRYAVQSFNPLMADAPFRGGRITLTQ
jgi:hypothetical protein